MPVPTIINIHLADDTSVTAHKSGEYVWLAVGSSIIIHLPDENALAQLTEGIDQAAKMFV